MTTEKLWEIFSSDEQLSLDDVKEIIYELKNDCCQFHKDEFQAGFYSGEMNAFYICLDLLDKVDPHFVGIEERVARLEAFRPNPITPENSNIRKCCPEEV